MIDGAFLIRESESSQEPGLKLYITKTFGDIFL